MKKNFALALAAIFALLLASAFADNDIEPADILYERTTIHANSNYDETPLSDADAYPERRILRPHRWKSAFHQLLCYHGP